MVGRLHPAAQDTAAVAAVLGPIPDTTDASLQDQAHRDTPTRDTATAVRELARLHLRTTATADWDRLHHRMADLLRATDPLPRNQLRLEMPTIGTLYGLFSKP